MPKCSTLSHPFSGLLACLPLTGQLCVILLPLLASVSSQECSGSFAIIPEVTTHQKAYPRDSLFALLYLFCRLCCRLGIINVQKPCGIQAGNSESGCVCSPKEANNAPFSGGLGGQQEIMWPCQREVCWRQVRLMRGSVTSPKGCSHRYIASGMDPGDVRLGREDVPEEAPLRKMLIPFWDHPYLESRPPVL